MLLDRRRPFPADRDGLLDVYRLLLDAGVCEAEVVELSSSARLGLGPSADEVRRGDGSRPSRDVLWDLYAQPTGQRFVGGLGGRVYFKPEAEFRLMALG